MRSIAIPLLAGLAVAQVATLVTTVYLHRALAHRALTLHPAVAAVCRVLTWITTGIRPRQWVAVHRRHHAHTDVTGDPHSPLIEGFAAVQLNNVGLYRRAARDPETLRRYARDIPIDRWDRALLDRSLVGLAVGIAVLVVALGWRAGLLAAGIHTVAYLGLNAAVNAVGHMWGSRPHENTARNNQWLAWLTAGEGLHNNHHAAPTSARLALAPGEIDPGWWAIRALRRLGLARVRLSEPKLKSRAAA
jgi:stearoyl-CoA desaturase (Delta-9 desaturase)